MNNELFGSCLDHYITSNTIYNIENTGIQLICQKPLKIVRKLNLNASQKGKDTII